VTIDQDKDVLAAEYVLGTLSPDERADAQALLAIDSAFAEVVRGWERRLGELSAMVDPVEPPPDMWNRIKAGIAVSEKAASEAATASGATEITAGAPPAPSAEAAAAPAGPPPAGAAAATAVTAAAAAPLAAPPATAAPPPPPPAASTPAAAKPAPDAPAVEAKPPAVEPPAVVPVPLVPAARMAPAVPPATPSPLRTDRSAEIVQLSDRVRRWRTATAVSGALAACLLALVVVGQTRPELLPAAMQPKAKIVEVVKTVEVPSPRPAEFVAVFQKDDASPAFLLTFDLDKRQLTVRKVGADAQAGKSYQLWLVSDKFAAPRSLGVIGAQSYTVQQAAPEYDPVIINRATYAISLEPEGGSPTGAPTGPVLYHAKLMQATAPDFPARAP